MLSRLKRSERLRSGAGGAAGAYLRFVKRTTRVKREPADYLAGLDAHLPVILAVWHGRHLLAPFLLDPEHRVAALVSRSADGEVNAALFRAAGLALVRGSGGRNRLKTVEKGGAQALREMLRALKDGMSVAQTADVPRGTSRSCGLGIITLARLSGRPIVPVAGVTGAAVRLRTWDRTEVPLPFGRGAFVTAEPIYVPARADEAGMEEARQTVEDALNRAEARARALAGG